MNPGPAPAPLEVRLYRVAHAVSVFDPIFSVASVGAASGAVELVDSSPTTAGHVVSTINR